MKEYNICNQADEEIFYKQCEVLENRIPGLIKESLLEDVDGSCIQEYRRDNDRIKVYNDFLIGAIYIKSDIDLDEYF